MNRFIYFFIIFLSFAWLPLGEARANTPLDCPAVIAVPGGYRLTQNTTCDQVSWENENNKFFNLNRFTLTINSIGVFGNGLVIRNGVLQTNSIFWLGDGGTLSNLKITKGSSPRGFFIEAGPNFTVKRCTFSEIPGVALDFFHAPGGRVINSVFKNNWKGISIQEADDILIENNKFVGNTTGVNLFPEHGFKTNNNTIRYNIFRENAMGITMYTDERLVPTWGLQGNRIVKNKIYRSGHSGILIALNCVEDLGHPSCPGQDTKISGNLLKSNGFSSEKVLSDDDGVTARATLEMGTNPPMRTPYPAGLAGVTLSKNRANKNADLGFDVNGVTDGGSNKANSNGNPAQCEGVVCKSSYLAGVTLSKNLANKNADLGFDVNGVTDGGGNIANSNGNPAQCEGGVCKSSYGTDLDISLDAIPYGPLPSDQLRH